MPPEKNPRSAREIHEPVGGAPTPKGELSHAPAGLEGRGSHQLQGTTMARNWIYGTTGNDTLFGTDGDVRLFGGYGNDTMTGGNGNDWYNILDYGDVVVEADDGGYDTVYVGVTRNGALEANVEALVMVDSF